MATRESETLNPKSAMTPSLGDVARELEGVRSCIVSAHVAPDPDAVGSSFGLAYLLSLGGCRSAVYLADPLPERMRTLLPPTVKFHNEVPTENVDAVIIVDTAARRRVGPEVERVISLGRRSINIDHHVSNEGWADLNFVDSGASAAAVIVWRLAALLGRTPDRALANLLYAGLLDDTGSFCFSNSNAEAFQCAAELVQHGAEPEVVANALYYSVPARVLCLQAAALGALKLHLDGRIASVTIPQSMLASCGANAEDTEGLVEIARRVEGTIGAFLQRELDDGGWKLSLRAKGPELDVNMIAQQFSGGGHRAAAGCKIAGTADEVERLIVDAIARALSASSPNGGTS